MPDVCRHMVLLLTISLWLVSRATAPLETVILAPSDTSMIDMAYAEEAFRDRYPTGNLALIAYGNKPSTDCYGDNDILNFGKPSLGSESAVIDVFAYSLARGFSPLSGTQKVLVIVADVPGVTGDLDHLTDPLDCSQMSHPSISAIKLALDSSDVDVQLVILVDPKAMNWWHAFLTKIAKPSRYLLYQRTTDLPKLIIDAIDQFVPTQRRMLRVVVESFTPEETSLFTASTTTGAPRCNLFTTQLPVSTYTGAQNTYTGAQNTNTPQNTYTSTQNPSRGTPASGVCPAGYELIEEEERSKAGIIAGACLGAGALAAATYFYITTQSSPPPTDFQFDGEGDLDEDADEREVLAPTASADYGE